MSKGLTPKQEGFVKDYLDTGNATEAARRNYNASNENTAGTIGWENMQKPAIQAQIQDAAKGAFATIVALSAGAENENVRYRASADILDRSGFKPIDRQDHTSDGKPLNISISEVIANKNNLNE